MNKIKIVTGGLLIMDYLEKFVTYTNMSHIFCKCVICALSANVGKIITIRGDFIGFL